MRKHRVSCVSSAVASIIASTVHAAEWNANVSMASDYIVRGLTRSLESTAVQGSISLQGDQAWGAGLWASSVEMYEGAGRHAEVDYFLTGELPLSPDWRLGGQVTRYEFTGESTRFSYDYTDLAVSLSFQDMITAAVAWSPDYSYYSERGPISETTMLSYELFARYPLNRYVRLVAGVGHTEFGSGPGYEFWSGGSELSWQRLSLTLSYVSSDGEAERLFQDLAVQNAWVATLSFRLR